MRLPQDRILHIDTELKDGRMNIVAEWQGELVRCKDCRWWNSETKGCKRNPSVKAWQEDDFCKYGKRWSNAID